MRNPLAEILDGSAFGLSDEIKKENLRIRIRVIKLKSFGWGMLWGLFIGAAIHFRWFF